MASSDATTKKANQESEALDQNTDLRRIINNAVGSVQGRQTSDSFFAVTYEELADQQIARILGPGTTSRPSAIERVNKIASDMKSLVQQVKNIPPEKFILSDSSTDVNTPASGS